jgi:predicted alpha/beta hydrolase family esterase
VLVGHSAGAVFILRLLERLLHPVAGTVLVSGFTAAIGIPEYDALNATFVAGGYDWERIRGNGGKIYFFSGDDDPYVPHSQAAELAARLGVTRDVIAGGGHLNAESGFTVFPELLERIAELLPDRIPERSHR